MLMRYGRAAILAAVAALMGNVVWAQQINNPGYSITISSDCCQKAKCCDAKGCCATGACCKDGKCCKDGATCCEGKKCDAGCTCCKDSKCECGKGGECCCKEGKCSCKDKSGCCCKGKTSVAKKGCGCPFANKLVKSTAIIMVMPSSLPLLGACPPAAMGMMPHPPMPMDPRVMMPPMPPGMPPMPGMAPPMMPPHTIAMPEPLPAHCCPCPNAMPVLSCPPTPDAVAGSKVNPCVDTCLQLLDVASELCSLMHPNGPSLCASALELAMMGMCPTADRCGGAYCGQCTPPAPTIALAPPTLQVSKDNTGNLIFGYTGNSNNGPTSCFAVGQPTIVPCSTPANPAKVRIIAVPSSTELEMNVGDETCVRCKKMTVKIGDNEITVSRFEDRVRVRGDELKATADCVRSDRKDRIILEGDVVLHYKKDGHCANVTGDCIVLNLSSGAVTIKPAEKTLTRPAVRINYFDAVVPNQ